MKEIEKKNLNRKRTKDIQRFTGCPNDATVIIKKKPKKTITRLFDTGIMLVVDEAMKEDERKPTMSSASLESVGL